MRNTQNGTVHAAASRGTPAPGRRATLRSTRTLISANDWDVIEDNKHWVGKVALAGVILCSLPPQRDYRYITIMPTVINNRDVPRELAVDALTDFIMRCREGRIPRGLEEPEALMELCVSAARRQR